MSEHPTREEIQLLIAKGKRLRSEALGEVLLGLGRGIRDHVGKALGQCVLGLGRGIRDHAGKVIVVASVFGASALLAWTLPLLAWVAFKG